ncbi:MAG TPA: DUF2269 family protein [Solirubrobacteraceae bacterium]|nr:DUF2269 family protein [Solirubrobacteraceae bacterium]
MQDVAMFMHLIGALAFAAGATLAGVAFEAARRRPRATEVALLLGLARAGVPLVAAGAILTGVFGLWLVHLGRWGYGSGWVDAAIVLYLLALVLGALGGRAPRRARLLAGELALGDDRVTGELRALLDDRGARAANLAAAAALVAIVALMVFKP